MKKSKRAPKKSPSMNRYVLVLVRALDIARIALWKGEYWAKEWFAEIELNRGGRPTEIDQVKRGKYLSFMLVCRALGYDEDWMRRMCMAHWPMPHNFLSQSKLDKAMKLKLEKWFGKPMSRKVPEDKLKTMMKEK